MKAADGFWSGKLALVTGGASFIGSTLTDQLVARGARVRIVDDLSSGHLDNIRGHLGAGTVDLLHADLREPGVTRAAMQGVDTVFHLAADHGGRGYVDLHQAGPASNFSLDGLVFAEALRAKVKKVVFASSGCVYPNFLQSDNHKGRNYLAGRKFWQYCYCAVRVVIECLGSRPPTGNPCEHQL